ncbi:MBL fold metallo-hydrolase [Hymenobacter sp. ISL-91]|uniref:MBL fold metallo-hydrolase n=1 Tax=Hymenobacter sp. ISL-91 TaxID=2819151 RepID=UPI001BE97740|nr:MBL fold metallo-hydrolase [Hymenobacter sp. ISL-91]MBT2558218.1 MBL fold metallo-hydrolase [Hymenobacter sp. ISL-91]
MHQSEDNKLVPMTSIDSGKLREVAPDVAYYTNQIVNLAMIGRPGADWVLVDAGMPKSAAEIIAAAILLTHGHFDHIGSIVELLVKWPVPVYAHPLEFPFLTGERDYPEPDTTVEGGVLAKISAIYPHQATDIREALQALPPDGRVPGLPDWQWVHVPGHAPGQVAFFRDQDRLLISADALITVRQDSLYRVLLQKQELCGPPVYLTTDWPAAHASAEKLAALRPQTLVTGHGPAMQGEELRAGLQHLLAHWQQEAVPDHGKWVKHQDGSNE